MSMREIEIAVEGEVKKRMSQEQYKLTEQRKTFENEKAELQEKVNSLQETVKSLKEERANKAKELSSLAATNKDLREQIKKQKESEDG